jgi:hypothetical protein
MRGSICHALAPSARSVMLVGDHNFKATSSVLNCITLVAEVRKMS